MLAPEQMTPEELKREKARAYARAYYAANKEKIIKQVSNYHKDNRDSYNEYMCNYMREHPPVKTEARREALKRNTLNARLRKKQAAYEAMQAEMNAQPT